MGRRSTVSKFPVARIKKIMQADEDVGKVAQATPVAVSKALEQFLTSLVTATVGETITTGSRKVSPAHLKRAIHSEKMFDFLKEKVENVPDVAETERAPGTSAAASTSRRRPAAEGGSGRASKRAKTSTSKKAKKEEEEDDDDLVSADEEDDGRGHTFGREEDDHDYDDSEDYKPGHGGSVPIGNLIGNPSVKEEEETPALSPNFNGGGMISHSSNYIPPGGPISSSSSSNFSSNNQPKFGIDSSRSIFNPVPEPPSAPVPIARPTGFASASSSKPGGLPPPRFAPGGSDKVKQED